MSTNKKSNKRRRGAFVEVSGRELRPEQRRSLTQLYCEDKRFHDQMAENAVADRRVFG